MTCRFRHASAGDIEAIAALHVESWRQRYRSIYEDAFLDGDAPAERLAVWTDRLTSSSPDRFTLVAEADGAVIGFAHVILDQDPRLGAVLQNIHVRPAAQRRGVGARLVADALESVSGLHVWVRDDNRAARAFYEACGGGPAGRKLGGPFADGSRAPVLCFTWAAQGDDCHRGFGRSG